ncbi:putative lipid II flippase FtsW [Patescibacteria group bacterium]|nr:putative lipid II flippase FtsW [Patescibacteria group bacterium]
MPRNFRQPDYTLFVIVAILVIFGLIMVSSASVVLSQENYQESYYYLKNQVLRGLLPGLLLCVAAFFIPYRFWKTLALPLFVGTVLMLTLVFVPGLGLAHSGAKRWLSLGPINIQPSEFLKLTFTIYLAAWLANKEKGIKTFFEGLVPFVILVSILAIMLILEPDIGSLGVIGFTAVALYFLAGARISHLSIIGAGSLALFWLLTKFFSHASNRLQVFLRPELDPQGIGYQVNQALLALGSGGILGLGLGQGLQKFKFLPEPATDSIIAVIGEELGFIGLLALLILFVLLAWRGFKIARHAPDQFGMLLAGGITSWIIIQTLINIAAICGLIPLTGITLPFISLGGSSLAISLTAMGILLNISRYSSK